MTVSVLEIHLRRNTNLILGNIANLNLEKYKNVSIEIKQSERADLVDMSPDFDFFMKRLEASIMHTPDPKLRYMIDHPFLTK